MYAEDRMFASYQCCFCGLAIEPVIPDTGSLLYTTCIDGPPDRRKDQEMFCHRKCLADRLHSSVHLYAAFLAEPEPAEQD